MNKYTDLVRDKFRLAVTDFSMLNNTKKVIVGFSGGADSICLLHLLNSVKNEFNLELIAAHVNHGIRGDEANRDAAFCKKFCELHNIDFKLLEIDCVSEASKTGESIEECGRRRRYGFFQDLCSESCKIATAHNCNDNAETMLFNLARGTSLKGACGIPPVRENIIRPILYCTRQEIEGYCNENELAFVTDSTNLCDDYSRNKIRHKILPVMEDLNSDALNNLNNFSRCSREIYDYLNIQAQKLFSEAKVAANRFDISVVKNNHKAIVKEFLVFAYSGFSEKKLNREKVNALYHLLYSGGRLQIYNTSFAEVKKNELRFFNVDDHLDVLSEVKINIDNTPLKVNFNKFDININKYTDNSKKVNKNVLDNLIDCDSIVGQLKIRTRLGGDRFSLPKRKVSKTLKKLFNECNVPVEIRDKLPLLCDDNGVVWIYGIGVSDNSRVTENSSNIIIIEGEYNIGE